VHAKIEDVLLLTNMPQQQSQHLLQNSSLSDLTVVKKTAKCAW